MARPPAMVKRFGGHAVQICPHQEISAFYLPSGGSCAISSTATTCCTPWVCSTAQRFPVPLEKARFDLLNRLHAFFGERSPQLTVIFDAARVPRRGEPVHDYSDGSHVQFALRQEADDLIETLIQSDRSPKTLTIVSDDHRIQTAARRRQCPLVPSCAAFLDVAEKPLAKPTAQAELLAKPDVQSVEEPLLLDAAADIDDDSAMKEWFDSGSVEIDE